MDDDFFNISDISNEGEKLDDSMDLLGTKED